MSSSFNFNDTDEKIKVTLVSNCKMIIKEKNCEGVRCSIMTCPFYFESGSSDCVSIFGYFGRDDDKPMIWFKKWLKKYTSMQYEFDF